MSIKAVIFDLDDTLYPEYEYVKSGFDAVAKEIEKLYGLKDAEKSLLSLFEESRLGVFDRYLKRNKLPRTEQSVGELLDVYRSHKPNIVLSKETADTLNALKKAGYKTGVITDGRVRQQHLKIASLGLEKAVDKIIITDELESAQYRKPHPLAFVTMCEALGVLPEETVYVGDNPKKDFAVKKYLPIKTVRLKSAGLYANEEYAENILPDAEIDKLSDIVNFV